MIMKKILIITILTLGLTSCYEEFLEVEPVNAFFESNYYQSEGQIFNALVAAYDPLQWTMHGGFWVSPVMYGEIRSDNANAGGDNTNNDQPGWQQIDDFTNDPLTNETTWIWNRSYAGIYRSNLVINAEFNDGLAPNYKAEAKFLRAYYHFDAFRHYGPVPVITKLLSPQEYNQQRSTLTEVFTQITNDLKEAIPLLPETYDASMAGRITKGAAQALLGKAYLYWADLANDDAAKFDLAAQYLQDVVNSGNYALMDDFKELFKPGNANNIESVFEIQHSNVSPSNWGWPNNWIDGNVFVQLTGIRGLCPSHPEFEEGWGFMMPTTDLYDAFQNDDLYRRDAAVITELELQQDIEAVSPGSCTEYFSLNQHNPVDFEGMWQEKYANYSSYVSPNGGDPNLTKDANVYVIRYSDVLLMLAEALHRGSGSDAEAMTYIDMVRERAAGPGDNTGSFRTTATFMVDNGFSLLETIWYERRAELAMEGDRWYDLVRSGRAEASLFAGDNIRQPNFTTEDVWLPVAQSEVDATNNALTVYPDASLFK